MRTSWITTTLAVLSLLVAACGGSDETSEGVATLENSSSGALGDAAAAETADDTDPEIDAERAALDFSACMREQGVDFPDLGVDASGRLTLRQGFQGLDPRSEEVQRALEICQTLIEAAGFGGGQRAGIVDNVEIQDALVEFSACLRDAGYDVGDIDLGPGGPPSTGNEGQSGDGQRGQGQRQGGFGDRSARFAELLGLDYEDPDVAASVDECSTVVDEAFAAAGVGQPGQRQ